MMVAKDIDPFSSQHDYEQAAQTALETIAFMLKQGFKASPKLLAQMSPRIFHSVRFEHEGYIAHFDHLVIHPYGMVVIENRGEPADLKVNKLDEWTQIFKSKELRISSPLAQGKRKLNALQLFLEAHADILRLSPKNRTFKKLTGELIIAISDEGEFTSAPGMAMPRVRRTSVVFNHLKTIMTQQRKECLGPFGRPRSKEQMLSEEELFRITSFLRTQHVPMEREVYQPNFSVPSDSEEVYEDSETDSAQASRPSHYACVNCGCTQLSIVLDEAQRHYEMMCLDCGNKAEIDCACNYCGQEGVVTKNEDEYLIECGSCLRAEIIFVEPQANLN